MITPKNSVILFCSKVLIGFIVGILITSQIVLAEPSKFKALVLTERGGQHEGFVTAALDWLNTFSAENNFEFKVINHASEINAGLLSEYKVFIQLNYPPYTWSKEAEDAFIKCIENGTIGWVGFHHATLLGEFDGYPLWNWFSDFMGGIRFKNYIAATASGTVHVEDAKHPVMKGVSASFVLPDDEWYTFDKNPRPNVHVLANVDESTYQPASDITMGDHPVVWVNDKVKARNVYFLMGHHATCLNPTTLKQCLATPFNGRQVNNIFDMDYSKQKNVRILSIDIMRGITLFLMLFVNDLFEPGVPEWMLHTKGNVDGMGLADWVFPGFLFMVGMSVPYAIGSRIKNGESRLKILGHILIRTASLLLIGVLMLNNGRLNSELSGINGELYAILIYVSVFLIWNKYPDNSKLKKLFLGLKILGMAGLIALASIFKAGEVGHITWFETGWWGILGLIGWGYLVAAVTGLLVGRNILASVAVWVFFIGMNILSQMGMLGFLNFLNPAFGVIIDGNVPSIVLAGLVISQVLNLKHLTVEKRSLIIAGSGMLSLVLGFFLRNWFIISKIQGTPSWGLICDGISMLVFALLFLIIDGYGKYRWAALFKPAGQNSLTTYLAPDVIYFAVWGLSLPLFFYKQEASQLLAVGGSVCWAVAMVGFAALLSKINIRLKL